MNDNDLITRREVELVLLEKGQKSKRYKLGEIWELNFDEIREALSEYQPEIVRCNSCECWENGLCESDDVSRKIDDCGCYPNFRTSSDWFCADGKRR